MDAATQQLDEAVEAGVRRHQGWRRHLRATTLALALTVICWDVPAFAINAIVSQDVPILTKLAATEMRALLQLGNILVQARSIVAHTKEWTDTAKVAYQGIQDLRKMTWTDFRQGALSGLDGAFPEVREIYNDARSIGDLRRVDPRSVETLRNILWEEVYGPALDELRGARENMEVVARAKDALARQRSIVSVLRLELGKLGEDCDKGEGACQAAARRAEIKQAELLTDIQESMGSAVELLERDRIETDTHAARDVYQFDRFLMDFEEHLRLTMGGEALEGRCRAGSCLSERYAGARNRIISNANREHSEQFEGARTGSGSRSTTPP